MAAEADDRDRKTLDLEAIARAGASAQVGTGRSPRATPELDARMRTCRAQLADWVTCPSAKTPQGKAKIERISAKLESIKGEIEKTDPGAPAAGRVRSDSTGTAEDAVTYLSAPSRVGILVDAYA